MTGSTRFLGHEPGETFEAELDPDQERRALERGSIRKVKSKQPSKQNEEEGEDDA